MALLSYIAIITVSLLTILYLYFKKSFSYWKSRNVPHIEPTIPYGNIEGLSSKAHVSFIMQDIYKKMKGVDKFCGVYFFVRPIALLLDLDLIKNVLVKDFSNFNERGIYYNEKDDPLSAHLFSLDGNTFLARFLTFILIIK